MDKKFTKGKWVIDKTMGIVNSIDNIGDDVVCMAPDPVCMRSLNNWGSNALLISKAPEMLEMLDKAAHKLYSVENPSTSCRILADEIMHLINEATTL